MSFIFPRALPLVHKIARVGFVLDRQQTTGMTRGGAHHVADLGPALWQADVSSAWLDDEQFGLWEGWLDSMRGGLGSFYLHRIGPRAYPLHYQSGFGGLTRATGGVFDGTALLSAVSNTDFHDLTINNLPQSFELAAGDLLSFDTPAGRALHRISAGGTSDALGFVDLSVNPAILPGFTLGALVQLVKPSAQMMIMPKSIKYGAQTTDKSEQKISFRAQQILVKS